jgi:hypothetical protein
MGIDHLDFTFRLEKAFKAKLTNGLADLQRLYPTTAVDRFPRVPRIRDCTVQEIFDRFCVMLKSQNIPVSPDAFKIFKQCVSDVCGIATDKIEPHHFIYRDLGFE